MFDPALAPPPDYTLIALLDAFLDAGISKDNFEVLFIQCKKCNTILLRRNVDYHECTKALATDKEAHSVDEDKEYLLHGIESSGLSMDRFEAVFSYCGSCSKYMTHAASSVHDCLLWERVESYFQ